MVETGRKLDKIEARKRKRGELDSDLANDDRKSKNGNKRNKHHQLKPLNDSSDKAAKLALLGGLV
jgi:hypothetical protein